MWTEEVLNAWCNLLHGATAVARLRADADRANLNCGRDPQNSKRSCDNAALGITKASLGMTMKKYRNLYLKLCSDANLRNAYQKAQKGKLHQRGVLLFQKNLGQELKTLQSELLTQKYMPQQLNKFIINDPKTRVIHSSAFRDRVVHHALVNVLEPIFERIFIYDSYANRRGKGALAAVQRFDVFKRKVSQNGCLVSNAFDNNHVRGYCFKADIKHYFDTVDKAIMISIIQKHIRDEKIIDIIRKILGNFKSKTAGKGMPLGNLTSQFFANVYLNELDQYVKHKLKAKYYIRYVDDFIILHKDKEKVVEYKEKIGAFLKNNLEIELHKDKSKVTPLKDGITFLGYRCFYHYKLLRKSNRKRWSRTFFTKLNNVKNNPNNLPILSDNLAGWSGYAQWANTYKLRTSMMQALRAIEETS